MHCLQKVILLIRSSHRYVYIIVPVIAKVFQILKIEQVEYYGYPIEIHEVTTVDGYILQLHRIPYGLNNTAQDPKKVAFFVAPLASESGVYFIYGTEKSLPYMLANLNYDVWVLNWRGSTYSQKYVTLDPVVDKAQFYHFR